MSGQSSSGNIIPQGKDVVIEYLIGNGYSGTIRKRVEKDEYDGPVSAKSYGSRFKCTNGPLCVNGWYDVGMEIFVMIRSNEETRKGSVLCSGHETVPKGRLAKPCAYRLFFRLTLVDENKE